MKIRFKGPNLEGIMWKRHLMCMVGGPSRPKIENISDLIKFCRNSKHELLRAFGILIDPKSLKEEVLLIDYKIIDGLKGDFFEECRSAFFDLYGHKADLFSLKEAKRFLKSGNPFHMHMGINHPDLPLKELLEIIYKYDSGSDSELEYDLAMAIADRLKDYQVNPKILNDLANSEEFRKQYAAALHPDTTDEDLVKLAASSNLLEIVEHARENLERRKALSQGVHLFKQQEIREVEEFLSPAVVEIIAEESKEYMLERDERIPLLFSEDPGEALGAAIHLYHVLRMIRGKSKRPIS